MNMIDLKSGEPFFDEWYIDSYIGTSASGTAFKIYREQDDLHEFSFMKVIEVSRDKLDQCVQQEESEIETEKKNSKELVTDIYRKIRLLESISEQQHIVSYQDHRIYQLSDETEYEILIRTEFLSDIDESINSSFMTCQDIIRLGRDICEALDVCERYHMIHGNICSSYIYLSEHGQYKLGNFIFLEAEKTDYTAPEILAGHRYDHRADIYSLGLVLYTCLNDNQLPSDFQKKPLPANGSKELGQVVLKACELRPEDRYQSAEEFQEALIAVSVFLGMELKQSFISYNSEDAEIYVAATKEEDTESDKILRQELAHKQLQEELQRELRHQMQPNEELEEEKDELRVCLASLKKTKSMGPWILAIWTCVLTLAVLIVLLKGDFHPGHDKEVVVAVKPTAEVTPTQEETPTTEVISTPEATPTDVVIQPDSKPTALPDEDFSAPEENNPSEVETITVLHNNEGLTTLEGIKQIEVAEIMDFSENAITDLTLLRKAAKVETLKLNDNKISDIRPLKNLTMLKELDLSENDIVTVVSLKGLTNLEVLSLSNNQLPNILGIEKLTNLKMLYLDGNDISNVAKLKSLKNLIFLDLSGNRVSEKSILRLQKALPDCIINY